MSWRERLVIDGVKLLVFRGVLVLTAAVILWVAFRVD